MRCFVLGSGTWGTTIASLLRSKGYPVTLWCRREERAAEIRAGRHPHLGDVDLAEGIETVWGEDFSLGPDPVDLAISVVPTQHLRGVLERSADHLPRGCPWLSASKGLELGTCRLPSQIIEEMGLGPQVGIVSGPSHAEETIRGVPTAVVLGLADDALGRQLQEVLSTGSYRVYYNADPVGVEWGGVLKNVIAVASGIAIGYGFGDNTLAALVTRGAVEMARLGEALGGRRETFAGLSGIGDLMVTCFSEHSRNRSFGIRLGRGEDPQKILDGSEQVVEGVPTSRAVVEMCRSLDVEMPIAEGLHGILTQGKNIEDGVQALLSRSLKEE